MTFPLCVCAYPHAQTRANSNTQSRSNYHTQSRANSHAQTRASSHALTRANSHAQTFSESFFLFLILRTRSSHWSSPHPCVLTRTVDCVPTAACAPTPSIAHANPHPHPRFRTRTIALEDTIPFRIHTGFCTHTVSENTCNMTAHAFHPLENHTCPIGQCPLSIATSFRPPSPR